MSESVRYPSVCLSQSRVTPKRFQISKYAWTISQRDVSTFLRSNFPILNRGSLQTSALKRGTPHVDGKNLTNNPSYLRNGRRKDANSYRSNTGSRVWGFPMVAKLVSWSDLERRSGRYFSLFHRSL